MSTTEKPLQTCTLIGAAEGSLIEGRIGQHTDRTLGMARTDLACSRCVSHLGPTFSDGPAPIGDRYHINSASLELLPRDGVTEE